MMLVMMVPNRFIWEVMDRFDYCIPSGLASYPVLTSQSEAVSGPLRAVISVTRRAPAERDGWLVTRAGAGNE